MKKLFAMLTSAVVLTACAFSFAACGGDTPKHTHDYGTQWVTNSTHHWHECKNDGCDQKEKDKAAHIDGDNNGKCDTCDYTMSVKIPVASVELSQTEITLEVDGTATLTATVSPDNATNKTVIWESDKTNIATVDNYGQGNGYCTRHGKNYGDGGRQERGLHRYRNGKARTRYGHRIRQNGNHA